MRRSAVASTFAASLELVKEGGANIRQSSAFGPIFAKVRKRLLMVEIYQEIGDSPEGEIGEELAGGSVEEGSDTVEEDITQEIRIVEALLFTLLNR